MFINLLQNQDGIRVVQISFYEIVNFLMIIGAVDGALALKFNLVVTKKKFFEIENVQVIGDANLNILNLVASWPRSTHDARIFNNIQVRTRFKDGHFPKCVLLGNSGNPYDLIFNSIIKSPNQTSGII